MTMKVEKEFVTKLINDKGTIKLLFSAKIGNKIFGKIKPLVVKK